MAPVVVASYSRAMTAFYNTICWRLTCSVTIHLFFFKLWPKQKNLTDFLETKELREIRSNFDPRLRVAKILAKCQIIRYSVQSTVNLKADTNTKFRVRITARKGASQTLKQMFLKKPPQSSSLATRSQLDLFCELKEKTKLTLFPLILRKLSWTVTASPGFESRKKWEPMETGTWETEKGWPKRNN